ncbi:class I SAM-dependent methyltransferase [Neomesorhizobium albiziae]|nr:50S ribosomal protein L11 methyltransferase [Mesorhizobium albiziae]
MRVAPAPMVPEIRLYTAHPGSGLRRLSAPSEDCEAPPPYWAYQWAGGTVLARHFLDRPQAIAGRRVLDLGSGSGIVGIAAAKAGARTVIAADIDPHAAVAASLNAELNGVAMKTVAADLTAAPPSEVDLVAVGDLFYERGLAIRVTAFLDLCLAAGIAVLVGDPGRAFLPHARLRLVAEYPVPDFGDNGGAAMKRSAVFSFEPKGKTVASG